MKTAGWNEFLRFVLPVAALGVAALGLAVRLVYLHLDLVTTRPNAPVYTFNRYTQGHRGSIISAGGLTLAKTTTVWTYHVDPLVAARDPRHPNRPITPELRMKNMRAVSEYLGIPLDKVMDAFARKDSRYVFLARSDDDAAHAALTDPRTGVKGLSVEEKQVRVYPQGRRLSSVLGFVSKDPTNSVGGAGIELKYEKYLKGMQGQVHGEKDAIGREQRGRRDLDIDAKPGCDVYLTIDHIVQYETEKALREGLAAHRAERAWAIVLSVKTGAVLAMACLPDYDPENFNKSSADAKINRAVSENYEPGSVMKTITACAVLNEGRHGPDSLINTAWNDPNYYKLPNDIGHVWAEFMTVRDALVHSSNIVFGKLGYDLGPMKLYEYMTAFGFGRCTGVELPGEERGLLPAPKSWDKKKWSRAPIGQGVAVTAMQLAAAYAAIGNDGELLRPYIVEKIVQANGEEVYSHKKEVVGHPVTPSVARKVRAMMTGVAKKGGTAKRAAVPGYTVAGKTGTAQMAQMEPVVQPDGTVKMKSVGYSSTDYHASFIGIVPATKPEIVILVTYQKPFNCRSRATSEAENVPIFNHQGGVCAAPTFKKIAEVVLRYLEVEPDMPDEMPEEDEEETK